MNRPYDEGMAVAMEKISRKEALEQGLPRFFTGEPCSRGHIAERRTLKNDCLECRNIDSKKHNNDNKERILERKKIYRENNVEKIRQEKRIYYERHKSVLNKRKRIRSEADVLRRREYARVRREINLDLYRERDSKYKRNNPDVVKANKLKRRAIKIQRVPSWSSEFDRLVEIEASDLMRLRTEVTGFPWHVDHMFPLQGEAVSGLHCGLNLQVIPGYLNLKKNNTFWLTEPGEWIKHA